MTPSTYTALPDRRRPRRGFRAGRRGIRATAAFVAAAWLLLSASTAFAQSSRIAPGIGGKPPAGNVVDDRYIVVYDRGVNSVDAETDRHERARGFRSRLRYRHAVKGFAATLSRGQVRALRQDPDVAYVTPDRRVNAFGSVPLKSGEEVPPTGVRRMGAATTTTTRQASDVGVAVIDSGIDLNHPDLNAVHGTNCVTPGASAQDDDGHGTHVAGTIGAKNNGAGVVGVAPGTKLYAVKVLDSTGTGTWSQVICGIDWATANASTLNIKVANMSLGGPGSNDSNCGLTSNDPLHQAICRSTNAGVLTVAAAGNDGWDLGDNPPDTPAAFPEVLTVTAFGDSDGTGGAAGGAPSCDTRQADDAYASFSNYATRAGDKAHMIAAPGVCIRSTLPGGYGVASGTSMASPHVAGVAALCLAEGGGSGACAGKTPAQIIGQLRAEAEAHTTTNGVDGFYGDPLRPNKWGDYFGYAARLSEDRTPPDTTISAGPSGTQSATGAGFSFTSTEPDSTFECKLDAGAWERCSSPRSYTGLADGTHTFSVRATDFSGNTDPSPATRSWTVDATPPETSLTSGPPAATNDATPSFGFTSADSGATFECRIDGGAWAVCASPYTTATLADGAHRFDVRARDAAGNVDATPAGSSFTVDTKAPAITLTQPADGSITRDATPALGGAGGTAAGDAATVTVTVYAGTAVSGTPLQTHSTVPIGSGTWAVDAAALADGTYTVRAQQSDSAGNTGTSGTVTFTVDATAPDSSIGSGPWGLTNDSTPTFGLSSSETGSRFECRVDSAAWAACSSPHTTATLADGDHTFELRAIDRAGNVDATPASRSLTIDTTPPDSSIASGPSGLTNDSTPTFGLTSPDSGATFQCRVGSAAWAACSSPHTTAALADGNHTFEVRAIDRAGNVDATPANRSLTVDTVVDTAITAGPRDPTPTKETTPTFEFAAGESGATFECRVDTQPWESCSSPHRTPELAYGAHTFEVRATDRATNVDPTPARRSFTIDPDAVAQLPPAASSGAPSGVGQTSAVVKGVVNPNGLETTYHFEYGTTTSYGATTPKQSAGAGTNEQSISAQLSGLSASTTYHYRLVATNSAGTSKGDDRTFTTASPPPPPAEDPPPADRTPAPAPAPAPSTPALPAPTTPAAPAPSGAIHPAKLKVNKAVIKGDRVYVKARMTAHSTGSVQVKVSAAGEHDRFTVPIKGREVTFSHRLSRTQSKLGTAIVSITYAGNDLVSADWARLRVARNRAALSIASRRISAATAGAPAKVRARGTIDPRARGTIRVIFSWHDGVQRRTLTQKIKAKQGSWTASLALPEAVASGWLTVEYGGYIKRRISGERTARGATHTTP